MSSLSTTTAASRAARDNQSQGMLRYAADAWPVGILLAVTALGLCAFIPGLPMWGLAALWVGVLYLRTFCPFMQHNHAHLPVFRWAAANWAYDALLALNTGYATALWELHHNRGHHRHFLTPEKDVARLNLPGREEVMPRWYYAVRGNSTIHRDSILIGLDEGRAGRKTLLPKLAFELGLQLALVTLGLWLNPWVTVFFYLVPNYVSGLLVWWYSYPHHLDMGTSTVYEASVTVTDPRYNLMTFNIGHHTAHHEKPTLHWSLLPARTAEIGHKIAPNCVRTKSHEVTPLVPV